jgi:hypothetical protein
MTQFKSMLLGLGIIAFSGIIGLANVYADVPQAGAQQTPASEKWSEKARVTEQNRRLAENVPTRRAGRMICKQEIILGTRLKGMTTCRTASEWRRISRGFQQQYKTTNDKAAAAFSSN